MSPLAFLVAFVALSVLGALVMWVRDREPRSMEAHMKAFERQLDALDPETPLEEVARRRRPPTRPRTRGSRSG